MSHPAGADVQLALLTLGDDVVDRLERAFGADKDAAGIGINPAKIEIIVEREIGRFDDSVQHLRPHIAEDQVVGVGFGFAHEHLVADAARGAGEEAGFEIGVQILLPDAGKGPEFRSAPPPSAVGMITSMFREG
jgi:hypothetical protein